MDKWETTKSMLSSICPCITSIPLVHILEEGPRLFYGQVLHRMKILPGKWRKIQIWDLTPAYGKGVWGLISMFLGREGPISLLHGVQKYPYIRVWYFPMKTLG